MEKIYMENKKGSKFSQVMNSKVPHHLSALMILVAFLSFLAIAFSDSNTSYAITQEELGDQFTTVGERSTTDSYAAYSYRRLVGMATSNLSIPYIYNLNKIQLFCLKKNGNMPTTGVDYKKTNRKVDSGIIYILSRHGSYTDSQGNLLDPYVQTWIIQTAIWKYQKDKGLDTDTDIDNYYNDIDNDSQVWVYNPSINAVPGPGIEKQIDVDQLASNYITPLVEAAKTATESTLKVTKGSGDITVTSDNKYYKSPTITVSGISEGTVYSVKLDNAPEDTKIYKTDGTEIKDLNSVNTNNFYMLVPIDKVTEKTKNVTISITGPVKTAYEYEPVDASSGYQNVTALVDQTESTGIELTYSPSVPDTGMSVSQSIYFIGLVILLCGVGIIYANARPAKSE